MNNQNATCIYFAAMNGHLEVVKYLYKMGADPNTKTLNKGWCPIHAAAGMDHVKVIKFLISCGCDKDSKTDTMRTPLHIAAEEGMVNVVKLSLIHI